MCENTFFTFFIYKLNINRGNGNHSITYLGQTFDLITRLNDHINKNSNSAKLIHNLEINEQNDAEITEINNLYKISIQITDLPNEFDIVKFKNSIRVNFENLIYDCLKISQYDFGAYNVPSEFDENNLNNEETRINKRINKVINKLVTAIIHLITENDAEDDLLNELHGRIHCSKDLNEIINGVPEITNRDRRSYIANQLKQFKRPDLFINYTNENNHNNEQIAIDILNNICNTFTIGNILDLNYQYINDPVNIEDNFINDLQQNGIDNFFNWYNNQTN